MSTTAFTVLLPAPLPRILPLPLFSGKVAAGFPSPADDYVEKTLDLNELLVKKPAATFFVRAQGESMLGGGYSSQRYSGRGSFYRSGAGENCDLCLERGTNGETSATR